MKNVAQERLKTCIVLAGDEFTKIVRETLGNDICVEYTTEGIGIYTDDM